MEQRDLYGYIQQLIVREDIVRIKDRLVEDDHSTKNRIIMQQVKVEYSKYLALEEIYWQQKAGYEQF